MLVELGPARFAKIVFELGGRSWGGEIEFSDDGKVVAVGRSKVWVDVARDDGVVFCVIAPYVVGSRPVLGGVEEGGNVRR